MPKPPNAKASPKRGRKPRKIADLRLRPMKADKAAAVKGGLMEEEGIFFFKRK